MHLGQVCDPWNAMRQFVLFDVAVERLYIVDHLFHVFVETVQPHPYYQEGCVSVNA